MSEGSRIVDRLLASEVKGDLLVLFRKNPGLIDTLEGVARRIGRKGKDVEVDVRDLVDLGVLGTKRIGRSEVIFLDRVRDMELQQVIGSHLRSLKKGGV